MKIHGNYFNEDEAVTMLEEIKDKLKPCTGLMSLIRSAMDGSACEGFNGFPNTTVTMTEVGYQVTANVCCGGYAELSILEVKRIL